MLRVVVDANVYVSACIRPEGPPGQIIEQFLSGEAFEIVLSTPIVEEVLRALEYPKVRKAVRSKVEPAVWFEDILVLAQLVGGEDGSAGVSRDPDDDKYIAAAIEGRAVFVVTGDPDLLAIGQHEGVRFVGPRAFLDFLRMSDSR